MNLIDAQNTFALRLYDWSLRDFRRELDEGCPLLSLVGLNDWCTAAFVLWMRSMPAAEREGLTRALPRRAHERAAALRGETLSMKEQNEWDAEFSWQLNIHQHSLPPFISYDERRPDFKRVDPDHCLDVLFSSLSPVLGKLSRRKSRIRATRQIGDWKLITEFIFDRRERDLRFEYQFVRKDGAPVIGHGGPFPRSLFMFYGLTDTLVLVPSQADSEPMAKAMATLAAYFVSRADPLFEGLGMDD